MALIIMQVLATSPSQWWLLFSGQTVVAVSQIFILGIPAQLAATWFPSDQASSDYIIIERMILIADTTEIRQPNSRPYDFREETYLKLKKKTVFNYRSCFV